jgi:hypothetical protein
LLPLGRGYLSWFRPGGSHCCRLAFLAGWHSILLGRDCLPPHPLDATLAPMGELLELRRGLERTREMLALTVWMQLKPSQ